MNNDNKQTIAVLDDEPDIVDLVDINLQKAGFAVRGFTTPKTFFYFLDKQIPDLLILDLMLPEMDGLEICRIIRNKSDWQDIPIIMLTAKSDEIDRIIGLELGADDYVSKPFSPRELTARVKAVLRRKDVNSHSFDFQKDDILTIDDILVLNVSRHKVSVQNKNIKLTTTEFKLLQLLLSRKGILLSREVILEKLWGHEKAVIDRTVDVHIKHLRQKLGSIVGKRIKNIRGIGYKID